MSTIRNRTAERATEKFARKNRLLLRRLGLEVGDRIRIIDIHPQLKDQKYEPKNMAELFRYCLGRDFTVKAFGRYGTVELEAGANREVRKKFGKYHTIWMEPEYLKIVRRRAKRLD